MFKPESILQNIWEDLKQRFLKYTSKIEDFYLDILEDGPYDTIINPLLIKFASFLKDDVLIYIDRGLELYSVYPELLIAIILYLIVLIPYISYLTFNISIILALCFWYLTIQLFRYAVKLNYYIASVLCRPFLILNYFYYYHLFYFLLNQTIKLVLMLLLNMNMKPDIKLFERDLYGNMIMLVFKHNLILKSLIFFKLNLDYNLYQLKIKKNFTPLYTEMAYDFYDEEREEFNDNFHSYVNHSDSPYVESNNYIYLKKKLYYYYYYLFDKIKIKKKLFFKKKKYKLFYKVKNIIFHFFFNIKNISIFLIFLSIVNVLIFNIVRTIINIFYIYF